MSRRKISDVSSFKLMEILAKLRKPKYKGVYYQGARGRIINELRRRNENH